MIFAEIHIFTYPDHLALTAIYKFESNLPLSTFASLSCLAWATSFFSMINFASFITLAQAWIHEVSWIDSNSWNIFSNPLDFSKFIVEAPHKLRSFDFIIQKACSTGASSGQYGAENLVWKCKSLITFLVNLDEMVLALSSTTIGKSQSWQIFLNSNPSSLRNSLNFNESTFPTTIIANHSPLFQVPKIRVTFPISILLITGQLSPTGSQE